jgi:hypothetical protein
MAGWYWERALEASLAAIVILGGIAVISKFSFGEVFPAFALRWKFFRVVALSCGDVRSQFHPPPDFRVSYAECFEGRKDFEAREAGSILRYIIDHYGNIDEQRLVFVHAHDTTGHYKGYSIWPVLRDVTKRDEFWDWGFGNVMDFLAVTTEFKTVNGRLWAMIDPAFGWANMADMIDALFNGTSMMYVPRNGWDVTCCATFFVDPLVLWRRPKEEYVRLLQNIQYMTTAGICRIFSYWSRCVGEKDRGEPRFTDNWLVGFVMEKLWGVVLANQTNFKYMTNITHE